eukprot:CAMPEP_0119269290 /NCGR_PEP_ID=MMETSP1329-20130426/6763_1 /TAXON_ID=114041 /ORGANISM="Genus nov. species nov., Strain RCC1024" /LENGTH=151 /DNA_ID=CAMNT_0007269287 /DNA_START=89 /DNA_END=540 /DNA_ORIENTATION=+
MRLRGMRPTRHKTSKADAPAEPPAAGESPCDVCGEKAGRYGCPRCGARYCSLACFGRHGACSERFYAQRVRAALAEEAPAHERSVGDLLSAEGPSEDRLRALLEGAEPTKEEEALVLAAVARGDLEHEAWAPWWSGIGRFDDDVAAAEAAR